MMYLKVIGLWLAKLDNHYWILIMVTGGSYGFTSNNGQPVWIDNGLGFKKNLWMLGVTPQLPENTGAHQLSEILPEDNFQSHAVLSGSLTPEQRGGCHCNQPRDQSTCLCSQNRCPSRVHTASAGCQGTYLYLCVCIRYDPHYLID